MLASRGGGGALGSGWQPAHSQVPTARGAVEGSVGEAEGAQSVGVCCLRETLGAQHARGQQGFLSGPGICRRRGEPHAAQHHPQSRRLGAVVWGLCQEPGLLKEAKRRSVPPAGKPVLCVLWLVSDALAWVLPFPSVHPSVRQHVLLSQGADLRHCVQWGPGPLLLGDLISRTAPPLLPVS